MRPEPAPFRPDGLTSDLIRSLYERSERDRKGLFLAEGLRFFKVARDVCAPVVGAVVCFKLLSRTEREVVSGHLDRYRLPRLNVNEAEFCALSKAAEPSGIIIVARQSWRELPERSTKDDLWLGVERVRSSGNLGTLMRSAAAFGATGIAAFGPPRLRSDPFDPAAVRASMGAVFQLMIVGISHREFRHWNRAHGLMVLGASCDAATEVGRVALRRPLMFMLGGERQGLSEGQRASCDGLVRIPMVGGVDSLNVAMAGTVLLYEAHARWRDSGRGGAGGYETQQKRRAMHLNVQYAP